jgi:transposase
MESAVALPDDIEILKALVREKDNIISMMKSQLSWTEEKLRAWELRYFGRKSEKKRDDDEKQNRLFDEAEANATGVETPVTEKIVVPAYERKKRGRKPKIDTLPVREVVYELDDQERACPCCGEARKEIGEERSSEYDLVPAHLVKIIHIRKKYGPCACQGFAESKEKPMITARGPAKIVKGSDFTNRTIAFFLTGKYADALPFYRMEKVLERSALVIPRATLSNLAVSVGRSLGDLIELMNRDIARSPVMLMDETTVQVLKSGEGPPGKSYMWVAVGYRDGKQIRRFAYHQSREGSFADKLLQGFSGYLQTDGYGGYRHLEGRSDIVHVSCFAHIRRKFVEAVKVANNQSKAQEAVDTIAKIYRVERECREALEKGTLDEKGFLEKRKERLGPIFAELRAWLMARSYDTTPQSMLGKAVAYAQGQFDTAVRFVDHVLLRPDTNAVENAIRPFVIGRKNWLFSGSPHGAHVSSGLYSLIETAKVNGHEPYAYLCHVFDTLPLCKTETEREALLPYRLEPSRYKTDGE